MIKTESNTDSASNGFLRKTVRKAIFSFITAAAFLRGMVSNSHTKTFLLFFFLTFLLFDMQAQTKTNSAVGSYLLEGVMETASGFQLNKDSTFQFFFSYGALDRYGEGKWQVKNGSILFESRPKPVADFRLRKSSEGDKEKISISLKEMNPYLLPHVYIKIKGGNKEQEEKLNQEGRIEFPSQPLDSIEVLFEFCPEKKSVFAITNKNHHSFEIVPEPWLMEIFFHNFHLARTATGLSGGHPLSDKTSFKYRKSKQQPN